MKNRFVKFFYIGILSLVFLIVLAYIDYITGYDLGFFVFYFIPISIIAWYAGRSYAIAMSFITAMVWLYVCLFFSKLPPP
jgi:membrane-associated HD superfamily phosphohydrolase